MRNPSDSDPREPELWEKLIGLGEHSGRKSYYPELQKRLEDLERFRSLLDQSHDAVWQIELPEGIIVDASTSACRWLGFEPGTFGGRRVADIPQLSGIGVLVDMLAGKGRGVEIVEVRLAQQSGKSRVAEMTLSRRSFGPREYLLVVGRDITGRKEVEEALRRTLLQAERDRDRLNGILASVGDGLVVTDDLGAIALINPSACAMLGCCPSVVGAAMEGVIRQPSLAGQITAVLTGNQADAVDLDIPAGDSGAGGSAQARSSAVLGRSGEIRAVVTLLRDLTRERTFDRAKSDFISRAAHELRTPLTAVHGYAELLLERESLGFSPELVRECLEIICQKSDRLASIVDDLLDLSRIEAGRRVQLEYSLFDVGDWLEETLLTWRHFPGRCEFELQWNSPGQTVEADRLKLGQVLDNLLSNAVKYSPEGGRIRLLGEIDSGSLEVGVEDQGKGIAPPLRQRVFEKFYRVDTSDTAVDGLGLGLSIARSIVEAHGGSIWIEDGSEGGTLARFRIPCRRPGQEQSRQG